MGQIDVYNFLLARRRAGDHRYFSVRAVEISLKDQGHTNGTIQGVRGDLTSLMLKGYLDTRKAGRIMEWPGRYRLKAKYIKSVRRS